MTRLLLAMALALSAPSFATDISFHSGPARTRLIVLYSSEGCSSCPPADDWVNALAKSPNLWKDFVPVVFHVTYWDYLGWKDLFAQPTNDERQRAEASAWGARSTYTPGLALDGEEWRNWGGAPPQAADRAGTLTASVSPKRLIVMFSPSADRGAYDVYVARLGFGAESIVTAGENAGRTLRHEFVARGLAHAAMKRRPDGTWIATLPMPPASGPTVRAEGLAVWVVGADGKPVQAAGGYLPLVSAGRFTRF